ncbi:RNA 2',3'-cyclic phosphodiesterase [Paractinoplanes bogorensis]|uniref:RNA 2',3'-cyclic phosphodiesterase n=1 Tax=Paractinoplanes bogorensis TaxID=1610840 RepID=UPI002484AC9F|nr:RNA 2',3'-cyclic phosphodiesterase [Actinoplanes bogorensis]
MFVAVSPPRSALEALRAELPVRSRLTPIDKWHLTLVFLGSVPDSPAGLLADVPSPGPFELRLTGGGRFGAVAWAGVDGDLARLTELRESVRDALTLGGFASDERPFQPHLTVSYHSDPALRRALAGHAGEPWPVTEFALVQSVDGHYHELAAWPL